MKTIINTINAPAPIGPYNQAVLAGKMLYVSGQIAIDPVCNELLIGDIEIETGLVMQNVHNILTAAGMGFENIVKTSIFLNDMQHFASVNNIYSKYFTTDFPARETVAVSGLPKGVNVEISVIAYKA